LNYLVHLYLSGPDPLHLLGGLMGDFVKGPLTDQYPAGITTGLRLHRQIDVLAHNSPSTRNSRRRLDAKYGHGRGIIVDIFYDHFLAAHWSDYAPQPLSAFAADIYRLLQEHEERLPEGLRAIAPRMIESDWLASYRHRQVVGRALQRIAQRLSRPLPLGDAVIDLARDEDAFLSDFREFMLEAARCTQGQQGISREPGALPGIHSAP